MRIDHGMRAQVRGQLTSLVERMRTWEHSQALSDGVLDAIRQRIRPFPHTTDLTGVCFAGVDGSGDFPALSYADSFIYLTTAQGTVYEARGKDGLAAITPQPDLLMDFVWLPEAQARREAELDEAFARLAGRPIAEVVAQSDYLTLKAAVAGSSGSVAQVLAKLIRPPASDSGNLGIQLRSTGELAAALRILDGPTPPGVVLLDGTLALPFVQRPGSSLFHEHLKRLCCVRARAVGSTIAWISKSHGLPGIEAIERCAQQALGLKDRQVAEHWFLRLPTSDDGWDLPMATERHLPPPGAVTYLARFHRTTPVLRIDLDRVAWQTAMRADAPDATSAREVVWFAHLDHSCHDQRSYGYPYPIKAGHDQASLTQERRIGLRRQIIETAVAAGMKRSLFINASMATGHA